MKPETQKTILNAARSAWRKMPQHLRRSFALDDLQSIGTVAVLESAVDPKDAYIVAYHAILDAWRADDGESKHGRRKAVDLGDYDAPQASRNHRLVDCELALAKLPEPIAGALVRHYLDGEPWESDSQRKAVQRCLAQRLG